ncbi:hypothetical protein MMC24_004243 [Lignoscripta atroalba]|nr:hypothetical protein [Lignoscripta atroalba]
MDYIIVNRRLPEGPPTITLFGSTISTARSSIRSATDLSPPLGVVTSTTKSRPTVRPSPTFTYLPPETATSNVSAGAKAGIGVGVTLGVVAFAIAGVLVYTRLRKRRMDRQISSTMYEVKPDEKVAEMDAGVELPEMHGTEMYHELEGDVGKTGELHRLMGAEAPKNENPPKAQPVD